MSVLCKCDLLIKGLREFQCTYLTRVPYLRLKVVLICSSLRLCVDFKRFQVLAFRNKYLGIWEIIRVSYNYDQGTES